MTAMWCFSVSMSDPGAHFSLSMLPLRPVPVLRACLLLLAFTLPAGASRAAPGVIRQPGQAGDRFGKTVVGIDYACEPPLAREHYDPLLGIGPGDVLTRSRAKAAIQALYDTGRFSRITLSAESHEEGIRLIFALQLNYYFNGFRILGDVDLEGRLPTELVSLPVGQRFTEARLEQARQNVVAFMRSRGYSLSKVHARTIYDEHRRQVDTEFLVLPGAVTRIRSVQFLGIPASEMEPVQRRLSLAPGKEYRRIRIDRRLLDLREYLLRRGFLSADIRLAESFDEAGNSVAVTVQGSGFGRVRILVDGFDIPRDRVRRLLPMLSGGGADPGLLEEGVGNLREYLEEQGFPEARVRIEDQRDAGAEGIIRYRIEAGRKVVVAEVSFRGNSAFSDAQLQAAIQIRPARFLRSSVYSISKLDADVRTLEALYRSAGYLEAAAIPLVTAEGGAGKIRITFECEEGRLATARSLAAEGNTSIPTEDLLAGMRLRPGRAFSPQLAERDRATVLARYNDLGFLQARVTYRVDGPDPEGAYSAVFHIQEGARSFVDDILVLGNQRTREPVISRRIRLKEGEPLGLGKMLETEQSLYE
ncbi:MAG: hypothetical protein FJW35_08040, partial [Acidobacteria bacterium]|nr:hypothetical protein [Acidobacteriota bacterium]